MKLDYKEALTDLTVRIEANRKYSSFQVEDVLHQLLQQQSLGRILDVGCGSGNYSELFAAQCALYLGLDRNAQLLSEARDRCRSSGLHNSWFMRFDMNQPFPFMRDSFDLVFFGYSAYYTDDATLLVRRSRDVLRTGGRLVMIGPADGNALELDAISRMLFSLPSSQEKVQRMQRLETEFVPVIQREFGACDVAQKDFSLLFPSVEEYARYYLATPQYAELATSHGHRTVDAVGSAIDRRGGLRLTKKSLVVVGVKRQ